MNIEIVIGILALVFGGIGWVRIEKHGKEKQQRKTAEKEKNIAEQRLKTTHRADLTGDQRPGFIDRL